MRAGRPTVLVVPRSVKVVMISTLQRLSSVHSLWHPSAAAYVCRTSQCNVTPVLVTKPLLRLIHAVSWCCQWKCHCILCQSPRHTVSVPVRQTSNAPAATGHMSHSVCFTCCSQELQCTGQHIQWSVKVMQTMHAAHRPTARPLYRGHCVSYDIAIWNATIYCLACGAMIWSLHYNKQESCTKLPLVPCFDEPTELHQSQGHFQLLQPFAHIVWHWIPIHLKQESLIWLMILKTTTLAKIHIKEKAQQIADS